MLLEKKGCQIRIDNYCICKYIFTSLFKIKQFIFYFFLVSCFPLKDRVSSQTKQYKRTVPEINPSFTHSIIWSGVQTSITYMKSFGNVKIQHALSQINKKINIWATVSLQIKIFWGWTSELLLLSLGSGFHHWHVTPTLHISGDNP